MKAHFYLTLEMPESSEQYIHACARIRKISTTRLVERLVKTVCCDQLVLAVLDDESIQKKRLPDEDAKSHYHRSKKFQ